MDPLTTAGICAYLFAMNAGAPGYEALYRTDGTAGGTVKVRDLDGPDNDPWKIRAITPIGAKVVFSGGRYDVGREPFFSDGTTAGTALARNIEPGSDGSIVGDIGADQFATVGGRAYVGGWHIDGPTGGLIRMDGTVAGTRVLPMTLFGKKMYGGSFAALTANPSYALVGAMDDGEGGYPIFSLGADERPIRLIREDLGYQLVSAARGPLKRSLFQTEHYLFGNPYLYATNGTTAGTRLVRAGVYMREPAYVPQKNLSFFAGTDEHGSEPWRSDGTAAGTYLLKDVAYGSASSSPSEFTHHKGWVYFTALDSQKRPGLWRTTGERGVVEFLARYPYYRDHLGIRNLKSSGGTLYLTLERRDLYNTDTMARFDEATKTIVPLVLNGKEVRLRSLSGGGRPGAEGRRADFYGLGSEWLFVTGPTDLPAFSTQVDVNAFNPVTRTFRTAKRLPDEPAYFAPLPCP